MKIDLSTFPPIIEIKENLAFANNGNLVLCFKIELPEVYSLSEKDFDDLHGIWFQALRSCMTGCVVHKQDIYRKRKYSDIRPPKDSFLGKATRNYFEGREYLEHESYMFFCWPKNRTLNHKKFVNPFKKVTHKSLTELEEGLQDFTRAVNDTVSFLNNSKRIKLIPLGEQKILQLSTSYFNGYNEGFDTDILLDKSQLQIGRNLFEVLAVNNEFCFGEAVQSSKTNEKYTADDFVFHQGFIDGLGLDLNEDHILNQIFYIDDKSRWRRLLEKRIEELKKSSNFGSQNKVVLERIRHILDQINEDDSSRVIRGHFNVTFWGENYTNLLRTASEIKTRFKELDITPYLPLAEERKNYFLNSFFCFSSNFANEDLFVTDLKHALCLLINNTNYKSDEQGIIFNDRQHNIPVIKDVWDEHKKRIKARNFAIFAPTGEGKSFLANNILRQYYEDGVRLVIIDLGGSYNKFAKLYPQDHLILRYEQGKNLGINPFFINSMKDLGPQHLEDLTIFLLELFASGELLDKAREVAMKKILKHYYDNVVQGHSMESFYDFIEVEQERLLTNLQIHRDYFDVENFLHIMSEYVKGGLYSFLFEISEDQSFRLEEKRLIVFELDEIKDNKEILSVMLKLIKSAIQRTIWQNRNEKGIILFDEFAKQLKFGNVLESVEFYYQAIRKQNGAIGIILQSINQLPENATSASILENTQVIYSLHNEKGYDQLQERLNLSSHDLNQLKSIKNNLSGDQKYTEIFIKIGRQSNIFRLEVPPEVYAAYLTDGQENNLLMQLYEETGSMEKAIRLFITKP
ncbi:TraG family conjugative transposon ATPase [Salinimicrobium sp. MT39]|uniref:TraG family conjugative transposon ATPase n=1 Tax=Salinimicrobium profundisediminis TaxID=2994553 RepID=A0A9X3CY35_9FLAO|nr:TraG family conjugative transposon ATPase [Salinimicrobium profundisediminis]MCX2839087.1 TraG family conjugative transposon ATPase [Salinimicrobium profundisediminis]